MTSKGTGGRKEAKGLLREKAEPSLQFSAARRLRYLDRLAIVSILVLIGLGLQIAFVGVLPDLPFLPALTGLPFLLAAVVLSWTVGIDDHLDKRRYRHDVAWETAPIDRLKKIKQLDRASGRWDFSFIDASNPVGFIVFMLLLIAGAIATAFVAAWHGPDVAVIVAVDAALLVLLQWFSGMRWRFRQQDLMVKVKHMLDVLKKTTSIVEEQGELRAQLQMQGKDEKRYPTDVKVSVHHPDAPPEFLGVQAQVVLNRVQGTPYPYFYAVVLSRPGQGLYAHARAVERPENIILETKNADDVEIAIIRQRTSKTSGYHTKTETSRRILRIALAIAQEHLQAVSTGAS